MQSLSDLFPKQQYAQLNIKRGTVFFMHVNFTNPPKEKFCMVIDCTSNSDKVALVVINTVPNQNVYRTQALISLHYKITKSDYPFLKHDSYVDCANLVEFDKTTLYDGAVANPNSLKGEIMDAHMPNIITNIHNSTLIKPKLLNRYKIE